MMIDSTTTIYNQPAPPPSSYYYYHLLQHTKIRKDKENSCPFFSLPPTSSISRDTCKRCPKPEEHKPLLGQKLKWQVYSHIELEISSGLEIAAIGLATCLKFISI